MRHFFTRSIPPFSRVVLVESGSRELFENLLPVLYQNHAEMTCDLVTCYAGTPKNFRQDQGAIYRVTDYPAGPARQRFYQELGAKGYNIVGIICSAEPIMTKWKWMLAARIPGKVFVLNENGDYFWMDHSIWPPFAISFSFAPALLAPAPSARWREWYCSRSACYT